MAGMMHANCRVGCCPRGSRVDDKRDFATELRQEFMADVPPEVEAEEELAAQWYASHAPHVMWEEDLPHTPETHDRPRAWSV